MPYKSKEARAAHQRKRRAETKDTPAGERRREYNRRWSKENREAMNESARRFRERHPDRRLATDRACRARRAGAERGDRTMRKQTAEFAELIRMDPCAYCGAKSETVDHIVAISLGGEHTWTNLTGACHACNSGKRSRDVLSYLLAVA